MNKQRLYEIISKSANLQYDTDLPLLKELIESFPYYPTPYVLLSKIMHENDSIYFDKNLKLGAAYIGNRELLYHFIKTKPLNKPAETFAVPDKDIVQSTETTVEPEPEALPEEPSGYFEMVQMMPESVSDLETEITEKEAQDEFDDHQPAADIDTATNSTGQETPAVPMAETEETASIILSLPKDILPYVAYDYFGQFHKSGETEKESPGETPSENSSSTTDLPIPDYGIIQKTQETLQPKKQYIASVPYKFTDWFDLLEARKNTTKEAQAQPDPDMQIDVSNLIDKFIQTEPRIKPQQTRMYKPEDMAKLSVKEDLSMATETLAGIYLKQGLKNKAIEIFQQLILRFPQKSTYFAAKIREIQSEGNL